MPAIAIREVVEEAYAADPQMIASAACDIQGGCARVILR
ncbi:Serine acetyltransferase [Cedecea neteri]|uniref:Serine acetyltransferase n=1 Tax=Cedecea neteri TaxID=158822 RepID=A0A2X2SZ25_9ENTR|nr:Serine acetyltransferase [Cedecea neteri]